MKKADMEAHHAEYEHLMAHASAAERSGDHETALKLAVSALEFVEGMMRFERKYKEAEFESVSAIELIFRRAPLLLDCVSVDSVESLLKARRQVERNTEDNLAAALAAARDRLRDNYRLWCLIESESEIRQDELRKCLGGDQDYWRGVVEAWVDARLLTRIPERGSYRVRLTTRLEEIVPAKCSACGTTTQDQKWLMLDSYACPQCGVPRNFVILVGSSNPA